MQEFWTGLLQMIRSQIYGNHVREVKQLVGGTMSKTYASELARKEIVTVEGTVVGELDNLVFDLDTGEIIDMVVKPDRDLNRGRYREDGKFVRIPFSAVCAIRDYVVVDDALAVGESAPRLRPG